ncbi:MAG: iron chelate uptake ABC transporter family permease subunit, partial [Planctomycetota bacterium]
MIDTLNILQWPFFACLILVGMHCYLGLHIVSRGVIFVDLSLAQVAALGSACAVLLNYELSSQMAYMMSLVFTFIGAGIFAVSRMREERVPQEAIIGIVFAVSSAVSVLIFDKSPHGHEAIKSMLIGGLLYVTPAVVLKTFLIYLMIGIFHYIFRKKFILISTNPNEAYRNGISVRWWDFIFYVTFGFIITSSVQIAGVLLVFSYLIVPT